MSNEIEVKQTSTGLVHTIIEAEAKADELRAEVKKLEAVADDARARMLDLFHSKGIKTVTLETGQAVTAAVRNGFKVTDPTALIKALDDMNVSGVLVEEVPAHREIKDTLFKGWLKEKGDPTRLGLPGIEFKKTEYLVIKK